MYYEESSQNFNIYLNICLFLFKVEMLQDVYSIPITDIENSSFKVITILTYVPESETISVTAETNAADSFTMDEYENELPDGDNNGKVNYENNYQCI